MSKLWKTCVEEDCESDFYIKAKDQDFFLNKGLELPKRCWACRQRNRREAAAARAARRDHGTE